MTEAVSENSDNISRFAVTGAGGFIGGRLASHLLNEGHEVVAIVRHEEQGEALRSEGAIVRIADVCEPSQLDETTKDVTGIFHLAALFNHPECNWDDYRAVNVQGTLNVMRTARVNNVGRVVHCSTVGVATEADAPPYSEETPYSPQPDDKYEVSKTEGEQAARKYAKKHDMSLAVIRPAQVYGPGDVSKKKFYKLVQKGIIVSPGKTTKHLIYIDDLCRAFEMAMLNDAAHNQVFLIAGEKPTQLKDLVSMAADALGTNYPSIRLPATPVTMTCALVEKLCNAVGIKPIVIKRSMDFFTRSVECDTTKSRDLLGFVGNTPVADGVSATVAWYRQENLL